MRTVHTGPVSGLIVQVLLLAALAGTVGLDARGWTVAFGFAMVVNLALGRALARRGTAGLGPADWVTLGRATLVGGVAALVADSMGAAVQRPAATPAIVALAAVALVLDGVDGRVARRTGTSSELGARFDMEVDAFLILVLSAYAAGASGSWVLTMGLARYGFVAAGWLLPWLQGSTPPRFWCKVVAVVQGVVLTVAAAQLLPPLATSLALTVSLALLAESFGRQGWWLWLLRDVQVASLVPVPAAVPVLAERG